MDWCGVYATKRVLGKFRIIQELEGGVLTLHTLHAYCQVLYQRFFIGDCFEDYSLAGATGGLHQGTARVFWIGYNMS
jgi:hypothetical protein